MNIDPMRVLKLGGHCCSVCNGFCASMNIDPMRVLKPDKTCSRCYSSGSFNEHRPDEGTETEVLNWAEEAAASFNEHRPDEGTETDPSHHRPANALGASMNIDPMRVLKPLIISVKPSPQSRLQ